jgi:hypothetical protein
MHQIPAGVYPELSDGRYYSKIPDDLLNAFCPGDTSVFENVLDTCFSFRYAAGETEPLRLDKTNRFFQER